jgi:hypothetical protein
VGEVVGKVVEEGEVGEVEEVASAAAAAAAAADVVEILQVLSEKAAPAYLFGLENQQALQIFDLSECSVQEFFCPVFWSE